jgi:hypothetical protein
MPTKDDMRWFKEQFGEKMKAELEGTPFSVDFMTALACQETGEVWPILRKKNLSLDRIVELCVGDTIDFNPATGKGRKAFPRNKAALIAVPNGQKMFDVARKALEDMAQFITSYKGAASRPNKFCHGFGIFQFDLQFFKPGTPESDPDYFLERQYADFNVCLRKAIKELRSAAKKIRLDDKPTLTDLEMVQVAIAYNTGGFKPAKGLKQGFRPKGGKFYGEQVFEFLKTAKTVAVAGGGQTGGDSTSTPPEAGTHRVTSTDPLRVRSKPVIDLNNPNSNVKAKLPNGQIVRAISNQLVDGFLEIETEFKGKQLRGFASAQFLEPI